MGTPRSRPPAPNLTDPKAVRADLLSAIGAELVAAAGGSARYELTASLDGPVGAFVQAPSDVQTNAEESFSFGDDPNAARVQLGSGGVLCSTGWECLGLLQVNGVSFQNQHYETFQIEDGRQFVLGPSVDFAGTGLTVTRRAYVSSLGRYYRVVDSFTNPGDTDLTGVSVLISGGYDDPSNGGGTVYATSSGDQEPGFPPTSGGSTVSPACRRSACSPWASPSPGTGAKVNATRTLDVPAHSTVNTFLWGFEDDSSGDLSGLAARLTQLSSGLSTDYFEEVTGADVALSAYPLFLSPQVVGSAGSAVPGESLTVTNTNSTVTAQGVAASDGELRRGHVRRGR